MLIEFNAIRKPSAKVAERDLKIGRLSPDDTIGFPFTTDESREKRQKIMGNCCNREKRRSSLIVFYYYTMRCGFFPFAVVNKTCGIYITRLPTVNSKFDFL